MELDKIVMLMAAIISSQVGTVEYAVKRAYQIVNEVKKQSDERDIAQLKAEAEFKQRGR